jgi:hypothetical protein
MLVTLIFIQVDIDDRFMILLTFTIMHTIFYLRFSLKGSSEGSRIPSEDPSVILLFLIIFFRSTNFCQLVSARGIFMKLSVIVYNNIVEKSFFFDFCFLKIHLQSRVTSNFLFLKWHFVRKCSRKRLKIGLKVSGTIDLDLTMCRNVFHCRPSLPVVIRNQQKKYIVT